MTEMIRKFTMDRPEQMIAPVLWIFFENLFLSVPAVAIYYAINIIAAGFENSSGVDIQGLWTISGVMLVFFIMQYFLSLGAYLGTFLPSTVNSASNKERFVLKLRNLPLGFFMKKESGKLINTFTGDFLAIEQSMVGMFTGMFSVVFACVVTSVFMFIFNPVMALALYISVPAAAAVVFFSLKLVSRHSVKNLEAKDSAATNLNEYLWGMKTLKCYNQTGKGFARLKDAYRYLMKVNIKAESVGASLLNFIVSLIHVGLPLMCFAGAYMIMGGKMGVVEYLSLIVIGTKIIAPVITWARYMIILRTHYVSASRIDDIMQQKEMSGSDSIAELGDIQFKDVSFRYEGGAALVLKNLSFTVPKNRLTAIVGPSGSGKTTILRLIARFFDATGGEINCGGKALCCLDTDKWIESISMVLQDVYLFHDTIRENILFGRRTATEAEMIEAVTRAGCHDFIKALPDGYDTVVGEGGSTLSGGEKQRISIARAILKNAPVLLLDEPTASLDAKNEVLVQRAIGELVRGRTVVMIAHRLKTVQNAHQIIVLKDGEIAETGTHGELLLRHGIYEHLWLMQNNAHNWNI